MTSVGQSERSHLRGSVLLFAGRLFALAVNFSVQVVTIRYLAKSDYGVFAFAISVTSVFSILCLLGMDKAISRCLAVFVEQEAREEFWGAVLGSLVSVVTCGLLGVLACVWIYLAGVPPGGMSFESLSVLAILSGLILAETVNSLFVSYFAALGEAKSIFFRRYVLGPLLKLSAALAVVFFAGSLPVFALGQLLAGLLASAICFPMFFRLVGRKSPLAWPGLSNVRFSLQSLFGKGMTFWLGDLGFLFRGATVPLILGIYFNSETVAGYQSVFNIARLNEVVLMTFSILYLPRVAKLASRNEMGQVQELYESTTLWIMFLSFPLFAITFLAAGTVPGLLYGTEYQESGQILKWLALCFFANATFGVSLRTLKAIGEMRWVLLCDGLVILGSVISLFLLIPRFGAVGAAWSVLASYLFQALVYQAVVLKTTGIIPFSGRMCLGFISALLIVLALDRLQASFHHSSWLGFATASAAILVYWPCFFRWLDVGGLFPELEKLPFFNRQVESC